MGSTLLSWAWVVGLIGFGLAFLACDAFLRERRRCRRVTDEERREAARTKRVMSELLEHPGWKMIEEVATAQTNNKKGEILYKPTENTLVQEYVKGEIHGIDFLKSIPTVLIESSEAVLQRAKEEEEEGE